MDKIYWLGYSSKKRAVILPEIEEVVNRFGFILDFRQFSDVSLTLHTEVHSSKIEVLFRELSQRIILDATSSLPENTDADCQLFLHITFDGSGKVRTPVPHVPG